ncbi:MAG: hypothetical protein AAF843_17620 [Bacteroidota bacterium]
MKKILFVLSILSLGISATSQPIDTIRVGEKFKGYRNLKSGEFKYLVYMEKGIMQRPTVLMTSKVSRRIIDNEELLTISHRWTSMDSKMNGSFYSIVKPKTLQPLAHIRESQKGKEAYSFQGDHLIGLDTAVNNLEADYSLQLEEPIFNFEIDLETFSALPLTEGYQAVLQFFHPGSTYKGPEWYLISVERSEELVLPSGLRVDTWVLYMDYNGTQPTRFWYTKKGQDFVKMEGDYNGTKIVKTRLF